MPQIKKLKPIKIISEGQEIPFREYAHEAGGSGALYAKDIREMFLRWREADCHFAGEYIAPIAAQVITDAAELDRTLYALIMTVIEEAYLTLRPEVDPNHPGLIRIK
ncbi:hypothetical protein [Paenibacillus sp. 1P03SA]|uniref:hypothetical protein n=1 Tax=Paenibacillus sp. 1P03SA TaxID=3132294 RepID=UPI0039A3173F